LEVDPWFDTISRYVDRGRPAEYWDKEESDVSFDSNTIAWDILYTDDIWVNGLTSKIAQLKTPERKRIVQIIKKLGYTEKIRTWTKKYGKIVAYKKPLD